MTVTAGRRFSVLVEVQLRAGIADPQGATIERALPALGIGGVSGIRAGKAFRFDIDAADDATAMARATVVADRLLANPVIEESSVSVSPIDAGAQDPGRASGQAGTGSGPRAGTGSGSPGGSEA